MLLEVCNVCKKEIKTIIYLPNLPITGCFRNENDTYPYDSYGYNQEFMYCTNCGHGQLRYTINKEEIYDPKHYILRTSKSVSARISSDNMFKFIKPKGTILEIGSNDCYLLKKFKGKKIAIDPIAKPIKGIRVINKYIEKVRGNIKAETIICKDVLEHIEDIHGFMGQIERFSKKHTKLYIQVPSIEHMIRENRFDQIFHEHIQYFSFYSLSLLLRDHGWQIVRLEIDKDHWGAYVIEAVKSESIIIDCLSIGRFDIHNILRRYAIFRDSMKFASAKITKKAYGYGAAAMLPILNYHMSGKLNELKYIIDDDKRKNGRYYVNMKPQITNRHYRGQYVLTAIWSNHNVGKIKKKHPNIINPLEGIK